ncbi:MAG: hypothetical protein VX899_14870 [Myxococcota bacterium]|nr:hypothetical protein [Myxococcota bacterium]
MSLARVTLYPAIAALLAVGLLVACEKSSVDEAFVIDEPFEQVQIHLEHGDLELGVHDSEDAWVERSLSGPSGGFALETRVEDGVLTMDMRCAVPHTCSVDAQVLIPAGVPVNVELDDGTLTLPERELAAGAYALDTI